jgi:hypothetical protein
MTAPGPAHMEEVIVGIQITTPSLLTFDIIESGNRKRHQESGTEAAVGCIDHDPQSILGSPVKNILSSGRLPVELDREHVFRKLLGGMHVHDALTARDLPQSAPLALKLQFISNKSHLSKPVSKSPRALLCCARKRILAAAWGAQMIDDGHAVIPPTGKVLEFQGCSAIRVIGGKVRSIKHYSDQTTIERQLGTLGHHANSQPARKAYAK